jgi:hypothetical protein
MFVRLSPALSALSFRSRLSRTSHRGWIVALGWLLAIPAGAADCTLVEGNRISACGFEDVSEIAAWQVPQGTVEASPAAGENGQAVRGTSAEANGSHRFALTSPCFDLTAGEEVFQQISARRITGSAAVSCRAGFQQFTGDGCTGGGAGGSIGLAQFSIAASYGDVADSFTAGPTAASSQMLVSCTSTAPFTADFDNAAARDCPIDALCLRDGRFRINVEFRTVSAITGEATSRRLSQQSGTFFYQNPDNAEFLFKILDACALNDRFWVFFAATTNAEFTVTVRDEVSGQVKVYTNPVGQAALPVQDTQAFATCGAG